MDAAINLWEDIITDFNQPFGGNTLAIDISMSPLITALGGITLLNADPFTRLPASGSIDLFSGSDVDGDLIGDGAGWFIDPTPTDSVEFNGPIVNAFVGRAPAGTPAANGRDFFSTVAHELAHFLGIHNNPQLRYNRRDAFNTNTGIPDNSNGGNGTYWVFEGPSVSFLMTDSNGGLALNAPLHSAAEGDIAFPLGLNFNGQTFFGHEDLLNVNRPDGTRRLPSNANALILRDAYDYDIVEPERFGTFHTLLDSTTGNLLIRGGGGTSNDDIRLSRDGNELVVRVDLGVDPPGVVTGAVNAYISRFPFASVNSITIQAGDGDDEVSLSFANGSVIPAGGIAYDGGGGVNSINASAGTNFGLANNLLQVFGFGLVGLTSVTEANLTGGGFDSNFNISGWTGSGSIDGGAGGTDSLTVANQTGNFTLDNTLLQSSGRGDIALQGIDQANLFGGADDTRFTVSDWTGTATLNGGGGTNRVVSTNDANFTLSNSLLTRSNGGSFTLQSITRATLTGGVSANSFSVAGWTGVVELNGGLAGDAYDIALSPNAITFGTYQINDLGTAGADLLTVNGTFLSDTLTVRTNAVLRGSQSVTYSGIEALQVNAGDAVDTVTVESTSAPLTVNAGAGNDTVNLFYTRTLAIGSPPVFSIPASVTVTGGTGTTDILNVSFNYETDTDLTVNRLTGAALGGNGLTYSTVERLNLNFGALGDILDILSTDALVTTAINAGGGSDTIRLGGGTVNAIRGPVSIEGGANAASGDRLTLQEFEPAGVVNQGFLGTPLTAGANLGFLGGFGMGGPANNVTFSNIENVQIIEGASNDIVAFQFATAPRFTFNLSLDGGSDGVVFQGTNNSDDIHISRRVGPEGAEIVARINGQTIVGGYLGGDTVSVFAGRGHDQVTVDASVTTWRAELFGEDGHDRLFGGPLADLLDGGDGHDSLVGNDGDDELIGGRGHDTFDGGLGIDRILAGDDAADTIFADLVDLLISIDREDLVIRRRRS